MGDQDKIKALIKAAQPFIGGVLLEDYKDEDDDLLLHAVSFRLGDYRALDKAVKEARW